MAKISIELEFSNEVDSFQGNVRRYSTGPRLQEEKLGPLALRILSFWFMDWKVSLEDKI